MLNFYGQENYYLNGLDLFINKNHYIDEYSEHFLNKYRMNKKIKYIISLTSIKQELKEDKLFERKMELDDYDF